MPQIAHWPASRQDAQHIAATTPPDALALQPCSVCGDQFHSPISGNGRRRSFCSRQCYHKHRETMPAMLRYRASDKGKAVAKRKTTKYTESEHGKRRYQQHQRWKRLVLSLDPSQRPQPKPNLNPWPTCTTPNCHNMPTRRANQQCGTCARETRLQTSWRNGGKPCVICKKPLIRYQRRCCSYSCEHERRRACPKLKATRRKQRAIRRARKRAAYVESVDVMQLLEWQDGRCYHCNCKIRLDVEAPHPKSLTLDHLVPLALGGEHSYANTVASCWDCNCSIKGDRAINEQLKCV